MLFIRYSIAGHRGMTVYLRGYTMYTLDLDYDEELKWAVIAAREAMTDDIRRLINTLKYDLYFGPYDEGYQDGDEEYFYPGFVKGADIAREWLDDNVSDVKLCYYMILTKRLTKSSRLMRVR